MPSSAYSREQIDQFLDYIQIPKKYHHVPPSYDLLKTLHTYMLAAVPYENLAIHYNPEHAVELNPEHLFQKIVSGSASTRTRWASGRVSARGGVPRGDFPGWVHIVSIVELDGQQYHVDIAFGGDCATLPMPLVDGLVHQNIGAQKIRLVRDWIPTQLKRTEEAKLWIYEYRNGPELPWNPFYCFTMIEFMPNDWEVVNVYASTSPKSWQTKTVIAIKFLRRTRDDDGAEEIYGKRMLVNGLVKENLGSKTAVIYECKIEEERVAALDKYFDIRLTEEEKNAIEGWRTALV
ncbi:hypothetical protein CIB48_g10081 [Xylaria polymorpha]|nr:hypothetical protein CIB48_g10081 [Xylaria polymorpha]